MHGPLKAVPALSFAFAESPNRHSKQSDRRTLKDESFKQLSRLGSRVQQSREVLDNVWRSHASENMQLAMEDTESSTHKCALPPRKGRIFLMGGR
jgi:hypothetical protein